MRSVTRATTGWRSLMPGDPVALGQRDRGARAPTAGRIGLGGQAFLAPQRADAVDPVPLRLDFVAADEQRLVALDQVEQQAFVGDPPLLAGECVGHRDVE